MTTITDLLECLQAQLDEIEALLAVFPEPGAVQLTRVEQRNLELAKQICLLAESGVGSSSPADVPELSGTLSLLGRALAGAPLQLRFQFPKAYPLGAPLKAQVVTAAPRAQADALQQAVQAVAEAGIGGPSLLVVVDAFQEAASAIWGTAELEGSGGAQQGAAATAATEQQQQQEQRGSIVRKLIWFHHIKNLGKRKAIVDWAHQLQLGGYSKPGFPGVVVVEGEAESVEEYVQRLRGLRWQAMSVRGEEREEGASSSAASRPTGPSTGSGPASASSGPSGGGEGPPARKFRGRFAEVPNEDMSRLAALCREAGAEELFLSALKLGAGGA